MFTPPSASVAAPTAPPPSALDCAVALHEAGQALERFLASTPACGVPGLEALTPPAVIAPADIDRWGREAVGSVRALVRAYDLWTRQIHTRLATASAATGFDKTVPHTLATPSLTSSAAQLPGRMAAALTAGWALPLPMSEAALRNWTQTWTGYAAWLGVGPAVPRISEAGELNIPYDDLFAQRTPLAESAWGLGRAKTAVGEAQTHFAPAGELSRALASVLAGVGAKVQTLAGLPRDAQLTARAAIVRALQWSWGLLRYCMRLTAALIAPLFDALV